LIEAGSGSGSFTHAAARAVFNGFPPVQDITNEGYSTESSDAHGKVFSYEFHAERHRKVQAEMLDHGLDTLVRASHRDVYKDGFLLHDDASGGKSSPRANAVFLDLPAPWEALPHLTRKPQDGAPSALDDGSPVYICTFSPCIEQVQKTISALRTFDWLEIETVEVQHKRIDIRREYTCLQYEGMRGVNGMAADVNEALSRLREVDRRANNFHKGKSDEARAPANASQNQQLQTLPFNGGKLIHRTQQDLKTHTSYLVFAVLPRAWSEEDETAAQAKWAKRVEVTSNVPKSQRQLKKEAKRRSKGQNGVKNQTRGREGPSESVVGEEQDP
jgi:tRNA (adenine57-N1/adenine58-N1)-methyltransferase